MPTQERAPIGKELTPLYVEEIHMVEGLEDEEVDQYLDKNLWLVPLFEIDVIGTADAYIKPTIAGRLRAGHGCDHRALTSTGTIRPRNEGILMRDGLNIRRNQFRDCRGTTTSVHCQGFANPRENGHDRAIMGTHGCIYLVYEDMKGLDPKFTSTKYIYQQMPSLYNNVDTE